MKKRNRNERKKQRREEEEEINKSYKSLIMRSTRN